jgi:hypothetical protein
LNQSASHIILRETALKKQFPRQFGIFPTDLYKKNVCIRVVFLLAVQLCRFKNLGVPEGLCKALGGRENLEHYERKIFSCFYNDARKKKASFHSISRQAVW